MDIVITVNIILLIEPLTEDLAFSADLNSDGEINVLDVILIINIILS